MVIDKSFTADLSHRKEGMNCCQQIEAYAICRDRIFHTHKDWLVNTSNCQDETPLLLPIQMAIISQFITVRDVYRHRMYRYRRTHIFLGCSTVVGSVGRGHPAWYGPGSQGTAPVAFVTDSPRLISVTVQMLLDVCACPGLLHTQSAEITDKKPSP